VQPLNKQAINLITYIRELSQLNKKAIRTHQKYDHVLWIDQFPKEMEITHYFQNDSLEWLTVRKPKKPILPLIPIHIKQWLVVDELDIKILQKLKIDTVYDDSGNAEDVFEYLDDSEKVKLDINKFIEEKWNPYVHEKKRTEPIQKLYDQLFKIYQFLQTNSESFEIVAGVGLLTWGETKDVVQRHLLTTKLTLEFNRESATFVVSSPAKGVLYELEEDMLDVNQRLRNADLEKIHPLLDNLQNDVWNQELLSSLLTQISSSYDSQSVYNDTMHVPSIKSPNALITHTPAFIMRKKSDKSFQKACDVAISQLEQLQSDEEVPSNIINILVNESKIQDGESTSSKSFESQEFYFPLMANEEQTRIVKSLNSKDNVLVQGPPGTGKTHTIANITSHLLATGNRVLITSQTAKALSVLKNKLPEDLQDLCVSLVGNDQSAFKDLEKVVGVISSKREDFLSSDYTTQIQVKENKLKLLKQQLNKTQQQLFEVREQETFQHHLTQNYSGTALEIAKKIHHEKSRYAWYPNTVTLETSSDFLKTEKDAAKQWCELKNTYFEGLDSTYEQYHYPVLDESITFERVNENIQNNVRLQRELTTYGKPTEESLKILQPLSIKELEELNDALNDLKILERNLTINTFPILSQAVEDVFSDRAYIWESIQTALHNELSILQDTVVLYNSALLQVPNIPLSTLKLFADDLFLHFENNGGTGHFLWKPSVLRKHKDLYKTFLYEGRPIESLKQATAIRGYVYFEMAKEKTKNLLVDILPQLHSQNELLIRELTEFSNQLGIIKQMDVWRKKVLNEFVFLNPNEFTKNQYTLLASNIQKQIIVNQLNIAAEENIIINNILISSMIDSTHIVYQQMITAISGLDADSFKDIFDQHLFYQKVIHRDELLARISASLQKTSDQLFNLLSSEEDSKFWDVAFTDWERAVEWRQVYKWLEEFSKRDESVLAKLFNETEFTIKNLIKEIGNLKAWLSMLTNMTNTQNKHLKAWANAVKKIGKGTGKNAARFMAEAQQHMEYCKDAIPAWIMPLNRVFENFEIRPNMFDIVIVDEASQSWHDALLLKYIAKKMIIVGDDKQISPSNVGIEAAAVIALKQKWLDPIEFKFADQLDEKSSFFDVSKVMIGDTITLREHFRCMPEIIEFSNKISYQNSKLIALRQYSANRLEPIKTQYLSHGVREGSSQNARNEVEAKAIVDQIISCLKDSAYDGKTIGVISLLGSSQADYIQNLLIDAIGAEEMELRRIVCGDAYAFQGDERDVIFLSLVAAKGETRVTSLVDDKARQRFNVAVSRAKDQIWLFHSITISDIKNSDCMRYQLLSYFYNPLKEVNESNRMLCDSQFERDVFDNLTDKGFKVIPQFNVSNFKIDLVVQGEHTRIAVECDGDHWHTSLEDREKDFLRQRILERAGWTFWRVLGSTYYFNPQKALESLWSMLEELKIRPYLEWTREEVFNSESSHGHRLEEVIVPPENEVVSTKKETNIVITEILDISDNGKLENTRVEHFNLEHKIMGISEVPVPAISYNEQMDMKLDESLDILTDFQTDFFTNQEYEHYKQFLRKESFEVLQDQPPSNTLYVVGTESLRKELEYISPKNNSFTYRKNGVPISDGEPVWSISFEEQVLLNNSVEVHQKSNINSKATKMNKVTTYSSSIKTKKEDSGIPDFQTHLSTLINEMKLIGFEVIDYRDKSSTIYVIGDKRIEKDLRSYKSHNLDFRFLEKGNRTTKFRSAWYSKVTSK
jgi:very-short-patch-repair endonuclease